MLLVVVSGIETGLEGSVDQAPQALEGPYKATQKDGKIILLITNNEC